MKRKVGNGSEEMKNRNESLLVRNARPYIDQLFQQWAVVEERYLDDARGEITIDGDGSCLVITAWGRDPDEVRFSYSRRRAGATLNVPYIWWILDESQSGSATDQLLWLSKHSWWFRLWRTEEFAKRFTAIEEKGEAIDSLLLEQYWSRVASGGLVLDPRSGPTNLLQESLAATEEQLWNILQRCEAYISYLLGNGARLGTSAGASSLSAIDARGERMRLRLEPRPEGDRLLIGPVYPGVDPEDWFDLRRITRLFVREVLGKTMEDLLFFASNYIENLEAICSMRNWESFMYYMARGESNMNDLRRLLVYGR